MTTTEFFELIETLVERCNGEFPVSIINGRLQYEIVADKDRYDEVLQLLLGLDDDFIAQSFKSTDITTIYRNKTYKLVDVDSKAGAVIDGAINGNKVRWYLTFKQI